MPHPPLASFTLVFPSANSQVEEVQAICAAAYSYTPEEYWSAISDTARDFIDKCLVVDPAKRMTAKDCLNHPWIQSDTSQPKPGEEDLLQKGLKAKFDAKRVSIAGLAHGRGATARCREY